MTTPAQRIDAALERVLNASGTSLRNYMPASQDELRKVMQQVLSEVYIQGSNDCHAAQQRHNKGATQ